MPLWASRFLALVALAPLARAWVSPRLTDTARLSASPLAAPPLVVASTGRSVAPPGPVKPRRWARLAAGPGESGADDVAERRKRRLRDHMDSTPDGTSSPPSPSPAAQAAPPAGPTPAQLAKQAAQRARAQLLPSSDLAKLPNKELKALAAACAVSVVGCLEKADLVARLTSAAAGDEPFTASPSTSSSASTSGSTSGSSGAASGAAATAAPAAAAARAVDLGSLSIRELRTMIHLAGLSSHGLLEKPEFLQRAREAQAVLDSRPKFPDAERYNKLGVKFFGRRTCPHCVSALKVLEARGLTTMLDVETDAAAGDEFRKLNAGAAGAGVPYFHASQTGKSVAGWRPGAADVGWIADALQ